MDHFGLFTLQLRMERKALEGSRVVRVPGDEPDDISRVVVAVLGSDCRTFVRDDVPDALGAEILSVQPSEAFARPELISKLLGAAEHYYSRSFIFESPPDELEEIVRVGSEDGARLTSMEHSSFADLVRRRPVYASLDEGRAVSACCSSREIQDAAEAWVFTNVAFRGRGLARGVVSVWARDVILSGKTAFYSLRDSNTSSWAVARSLGVSEWLRTLVFE